MEKKQILTAEMDASHAPTEELACKALIASQ
jgi:hypothetical protein